MFSVQAVVDAVLEVTGGEAHHHKPAVTSDDVLTIMDQARDLGNYRWINDLERQLQEACQVRRAVATSTGSSALEVALRIIGVKPGDQVIVPTLSFVAAANAVTRIGANPMLVDADRENFGLNVHEVSQMFSTCAPAAIIAVHMFGYPCNIRGVCEIAAFHGIPVIEDAAEAVGSSVIGRPCGSFGTVSVLSFNLNKTITSGGGGAILTNDQEMGDRAAHLVATARTRHPWLVEHDEAASNHRMSMLAGALACSQMRRLPRLLKAKRALARAYKLVLEDVDGVVFCEEQHGTTANYWLPTILVPGIEEREAVLTALHNHGVLARAAFTPMHRLPMYKRIVSYPVADEVFERAICLPAGLELAERFI